MAPGGRVACGHYDRLDEDLELIARLGVDSYRFSVAWPRIQPDGKTLHPAGFDFYERLVDGLLARGIAPMATVYHWDHPLALEDDGDGWLNPVMPQRFAEYAGLVGARLGDRVRMWITVNEPLSVMMAGINGGRLTADEGLRVAEHLMEGHALAVGALPGQVGIALNLSGVEAASEADLAAAERARELEDRWFLERALATPIDFLGVNWYAPARIAAAPGSALGYARVDFPGVPKNMLGWPILPERFGVLLEWLRENYPGLPPIFVTENGIPLPDGVDDPVRVAYMSECLAQVRTAMARGMDIRGYYAWSLMDNLEWDHGFGPRFGLAHVDFDTLRRTARQSFHWYREEIGRWRH